MTKTSLIHSKSNKYCRTDTVTGFRSNDPVVSFNAGNNLDVSVPVVVGDWYWIVRGGDSVMAELQQVTHRSYSDWHRLDFKR